MPDSSFKLESPSFGPEQSVHVEYQQKMSRGVRSKLPIDPREVNGHLTVFKIGQNLDFLQLGQRRLGTSGMVRVDIKVVPIGPL